MRKRMIHSIVGFVFAGILTGCAGPQAQEASTDAQRRQAQIAGVDPMGELSRDYYGDYRETGGEIAFVSDGAVMDRDCNEAVYEGIRMYALSAGVSFSCYSAQDGTLESRIAALKRALDNQAQVVVCLECDFREAVERFQNSFPEISFLLIDQAPEEAEDVLEENVHAVSFREEESGYLAGYLTVLEGHHRLGFIGGGKTPSIMRYGHGYLQGIDDAARELALDDVAVSCWYAENGRPSPEIYEKAAQWYARGTEVIFACGGTLYESVLEAADKEGGLLIGADVDRSGRSERFLTSAEKGIANAVAISLDEYYAAGRRWPEGLAGQNVRYGAAQNCAGIPVYDTEWRFRNVTMGQFYEVYKKIRRGEIAVSDEIGEEPEISVTLLSRAGDDSFDRGTLIPLWESLACQRMECEEPGGGIGDGFAG